LRYFGAIAYGTSEADGGSQQFQHKAVLDPEFDDIK
jgi:hypothetical protein